MSYAIFTTLRAKASTCATVATLGLLAPVTLPAQTAQPEAASAPAAAPTASSLTISAEADRNTVPLDGLVNLTVAVEWTGSADRYRFVWPETPGTFLFDISGSRRSARSWVDEAGEHALQGFTFVLRPARVGAGRVDPISVTYIDVADTTAGPRTLLTQAISIEITPPAEQGYFGWKDVVFIALGVVVLALVVLAVMRLRPKREPEAEAPPPADDLDEHVAAMERARADKDVGKFYGEVLQLVRLLLAKSLGVQTGGKGPSELVALLKDLPEEIQAEEDSLRRMLEEMDRRRFAPSQCEDWELDQAQRVIHNLMLAIVPEKSGESREGETSAADA